MVHTHTSRKLAVVVLIICCAIALGTTTYATAAPKAAHGAVHDVVNLTRLAQEEMPSVTVSDQPISNGTIVVDEVVATQDSWLIVHTANAEGRPIVDQVVGQTQIPSGPSTDVNIELTESFNPGDQLMVMLHVDKGTKGVLEFPSGPDAAVRAGDEVVVDLLTVTAEQGDDSAEASPSASPEVTELPDTGMGSTAASLLLVLAGLLMIGAAIFRIAGGKITH